MRDKATARSASISFGASINSNELLTKWHETILPSDVFVGGVTPGPVGFVVWVTAEVVGVSQCSVRELRHIIAGVRVRALLVPALTGLLVFGE